MKNWFKKPKVQMVFTVLGALVGLLIATLLLSSLNRGATTDNTIDTTKISAAEQTYIVTRSGIAPVAWTPSETEVKAGFYPVKPAPANQIINFIKNDTNYTAISVNPETNIVSLAYPKTDTKAGIVYAGTLLPAQLDAVLTGVDSSKATVEVVPSVSSTPVFVASKNSNSYTSTNGVASVSAVSGSQWSVTSENKDLYSSSSNMILTPNSVGSSNPYIKAINNERTSASNQAMFDVFGFISPFIFIGIIILLFFLMRRAAIKADQKEKRDIIEGSGRKAKGKDDVPATRFTDIAGCDEAIEDMQELVEYLKDPAKFTRVGAKPPHGALLVGPPGTGKTLLARAVAGEAGVPFYAVAGSDFVEMYVGVGAKRVRELFNKAKKHPEGAIVFIDEIDAVARSRSGGASVSNNTEAENTLNALLVEMDGFEQSPIIVLGATNRDDILDKAILRPGRLERKIHVGLPDRAGREKILAIYVNSKPVAEDVDLNLIARRTPGMSGADLAQLVNEACLVAAREGRDLVDVKDFDAAVATVAMGKARLSAVVTEHDRTITAWHEAGHTVSAMVLPDADPPVSVSIIPRGPAGGITWMAPGDNIFLTRRQAFARLVVAMSGRAAEEIYLNGEFTSGPHGDLSAATETALAMVTKYGMTDAGLMIKSEGLLSTGSKVTDETIVAVEALLAEALETARATLAAHKDLLESIVAGLLENDTLVLSDLDILEGKVDKVHPVLPAPPKEYRKEKVKSVEPVTVPAIERVVFETPKRKRGIRIGRLFISLEKKRRKGGAV